MTEVAIETPEKDITVISLKKEIGISIFIHTDCALIFDREIPFNEKKAWQYRVGGIVLILMSIGFLIFL